MGQKVTVEEVDLDCAGEYSYKEYKISLDQSMSDERKDITLIHEIIHAIYDICGYDNAQTNESLEEVNVSILARALYQLGFRPYSDRL